MIRGHPDEKVAKGHGKSIDTIANTVEKCRDKLVRNNWVQVKSVSYTSWKAEFQFVVVQIIVLNEAQKHLALWTAAEKIKKLDKYKHLADEIDQTLNTKYLKQSPIERFLTAHAYKWLQWHETHPPKDSNWYPDLAIEVARKLFQLKGNPDTFLRYLDNTSRRNMLKSIHFRAPSSQRRRKRKAHKVRKFF